MSYYHNNTQLPLDRPFTLNDEQFGANWLRLAGDDDKEKRGIEWRDDPQRQFKNEQFYYNTVDSDGNVVSTPKDVDMLKRGMTANANRAAHSMLAGSDYMVVKQAEVGVGVLPQWTDYRTAVREESNRITAAVEAATDIAGLEAIKNNWPRNPDELAEEARREAEIEAAKLERDGEE